MTRIHFKLTKILVNFLELSIALTMKVVNMENKKSRPSFFEEGREGDGGDKLLFAGNHSRQQQTFLWNLLDMVGLLEQFLRLVTAA